MRPDEAQKVMPIVSTVMSYHLTGLLIGHGGTCSLNGYGFYYLLVL